MTTTSEDTERYEAVTVARLQAVYEAYRKSIVGEGLMPNNYNVWVALYGSEVLWAEIVRLAQENEGLRLDVTEWKTESDGYLNEAHNLREKNEQLAKPVTAMATIWSAWMEYREDDLAPSCDFNAWLDRNYGLAYLDDTFKAAALVAKASEGK